MNPYPEDEEDAKAAFVMFMMFLVSLLLWVGVLYAVLWLMS